MKNYSELIRDKQKRMLSAKGHKFVWRCIDILAKQNGTNGYDPNLKGPKNKLREILHHLMIDKEMSIEEIKTLIKNRKIGISN